MAREDTVWVNLKVAKIKMDREKSFLVVLPDGEETFLPKSQVCQPEKFTKDQENVVMKISEWIAGEKNLQTS